MIRAALVLPAVGQLGKQGAAVTAPWMDLLATLVLLIPKVQEGGLITSVGTSVLCCELFPHRCQLRTP
jgi:hypothetical protein